MRDIPIYKVENVRGVATVTVNGRPVCLMGVKEGSKQGKYYRQFAAQGFDWFVFNHKLDDSWLGDGRLDFRQLDRELDAILAANRRARILIELHANAPSWWERQHPAELHRAGDGTLFGQSLASRLWLRDAGAAVRRCVAHVERRCGRNVAGYFVGAGHTWEWFYRGGQFRYLSDQSRPMRDAFRRWLQRKYRRAAELRAAWRDTGVDFRTAALPSRDEQLATDLLSFRDPRRSRRVLDFLTFSNELPAADILFFARTVKRASGYRKLFGVFYGHLLDWINNPRAAQCSGHLALGKIIGSPLIDIFAGPNSYFNRTLGFEAAFTSATHSCQLHHKLWLAETDTRTHRAELYQDCCGRPDNLRDTLVALKRDFANALTGDVGLVWFSLFEGWFDDRAVLNLLGRMRRIADRAIRAQRGSVAEIAAFVDEASLLHQGLSHTYIVDPFISQEPRAADFLSRIGAPCDVFLLSDLPRLDVSRYKLCVFLNAFYIPDNIRRAIRERLQRDNKTLAWIYAPGLVNRDLSPANMTEVTGMRFGRQQLPGELFVKISNSDHPLTAPPLNLGSLLPYWVGTDFDRDKFFGVNKCVGPIFHCRDRRAVTLGRYTGSGQCGFAVKSMPGWNSVFVGTPFIPPLFLRRLARFAGAFIYNDSENLPPPGVAGAAAAGWGNNPFNPSDDIFHVNRSFLMLHSKFAGRRRLRLPSPRTVVDVFSEKVVAKNATEIIIDCPSKFSLAYYMGEVPWSKI